MVEWDSGMVFGKNYVLVTKSVIIFLRGLQNLNKSIPPKQRTLTLWDAVTSAVCHSSYRRSNLYNYRALRPFLFPVFDWLLYTKVEGEGQINLNTWSVEQMTCRSLIQRSYRGTRQVPVKIKWTLLQEFHPFFCCDKCVVDRFCV